jgi:phage-related tail protein
MTTQQVELLQMHVWRSLQHGLERTTGPVAVAAAPADAAAGPADAAAAAAPAKAADARPLWRLLMSDWVSLHVRHPQVRQNPTP